MIAVWTPLVALVFGAPLAYALIVALGARHASPADPAEPVWPFGAALVLCPLAIVGTVLACGARCTRNVAFTLAIVRFGLLLTASLLAARIARRTAALRPAIAVGTLALVLVSTFAALVAESDAWP